MNKQKQCCYCGQVFTPKNSKARFCSTRHRVAYFKRKKRRLQIEAIRRRLGLPALLSESEEAVKFNQILDRISNSQGDPR